MSQLGIEAIDGICPPDLQQELEARNQADSTLTLWSAEARKAIAAIAARQRTFTSDDIWREQPHLYGGHSGLGSVLQSMARDGAIAATGQWVASDRQHSRTRPVRVWVSLGPIDEALAS